MVGLIAVRLLIQSPPAGIDSHSCREGGATEQCTTRTISQVRWGQAPSACPHLDAVSLTCVDRAVNPCHLCPVASTTALLARRPIQVPSCRGIAFRIFIPAMYLRRGRAGQIASFRPRPRRSVRACRSAGGPGRARRRRDLPTSEGLAARPAAGVGCGS